MSFEFLLNADFDLSLRPRWRPPVVESAQHRISDLAWHALFLAGAGDSVLVPEPAPGGFIDYLDRLGIEAPTLSAGASFCKEQSFAPFGWNADAAARNRHYRSPVDHPSTETVTRVNGRLYSARLENDLFGGDHIIGAFTNETDLHESLAITPDAPAGWVLKAEHGNAGLGNRRLRQRHLEEGDLKVVRRFFDEDDTVVLERWQPRVRDLCSTFTVTEDGDALGIGVHEMVNTADGALIGALFEEDPTPLAGWRSPMTEAAISVAARLAEAGFYGRVCIDAFVWDDGGQPRLRPLVDLNARREMSAGASRLWRRLGGRGAAYWRFFNRRKLHLPGSYREFEEALGDDAFDPRTSSGALLTAPLWLGPDSRTPAKAAMLMLGRHREEVFTLDGRIRERLEK